MKEYRCLIVEDEPLAAEVLQDYIEQVPNLKLVGICEDAVYAMEALRKQNIDLLFLDIETTGLHPERAELIELSAIRVSAAFTEELAEFDELVRPLEEIPPFITRLTGISNEMVKDAPEISKVHEDFKKFLVIICRTIRPGISR